MATHAVNPQGEGLEGLLEASPDPGVHTSAAAEVGFLFGLAGLIAAPFSITFGLALGLSVVGGAAAFVGVVATSRANVAGRALAPWGLMFAVVALLLLGVRFLGVDSAFGDQLLPTLGGWLDGINGWAPHP